MACRQPAPGHPGWSLILITFCVRGVISPLLANIYLARLDRVLDAEGVAFGR